MIDNTKLQQIASSRCPCIKFGTGNNARHFPAETLTIVSQQPLKGKAPAFVVVAMINNAREMPKPSREKIATYGLQLLRLDPQSSILVSCAKYDLDD